MFILASFVLVEPLCDHYSTQLPHLSTHIRYHYDAPKYFCFQCRFTTAAAKSNVQKYYCNCMPNVDEMARDAAVEISEK